MSGVATSTNFWANTPSLVSSAPGGITPSTTDFAKSPSAIAPDTFRAWTRDKQVEYIRREGAIPAGGTTKAVTFGTGPSAVTFSIAATQTLKYQLPQASAPQFAGNEFTVDPFGRPATDTEKATAPWLLDAKAFLAWSPADQLAYVQHWGTSEFAVAIGTTDGAKIFATAVPDVQAGAGIIQLTPGDYEPIPYYYLNGSNVGTPSKIVADSADKLFPKLDGETHTLSVEDRPANFYTTNAQFAAMSEDDKTAWLKDFAKWHSGYQLEYVRTYGTGGVLDRSAGTDPTSPRMTAVVSTDDPTKLFIVQSLDKAAFARMTALEQIQISGLDAFTKIAPKLGLSSVTAAVVTDITSTETPKPAVSATEAVTALSTYIMGKTPDSQPSKVLDKKVSHDEDYNPVSEYGSPGANASWVRTVSDGPFPFSKTYTWTLTYQPPTPPNMPEADRLYFTKQLDIMNEQLAGMGVVSGQDIAKKISDLKDRFERAFAFFAVNPPSQVNFYMGNPNSNGHVYSDVVSINGDMSGISRGYQVFIAQEKRISELADERMQLVRDNGILLGKNLDVPYLVYKFQSLYNLQLEAQVVMETEEVNQQNDLLKTYARMQDVINKTIANFAKADEDGRYILGKNVDALADSSSNFTVLTNEERYILSMFEDVVGAGQQHPLEKLRNIKRPTGEIFQQFLGSDGSGDSNYDLAKQTHPQWSTFGTRLSETVTLINQNSQIKMNDINSMDKQRNRHFELANNALSKMNEMIQNIARSG